MCGGGSGCSPAAPQRNATRHSGGQPGCPRPQPACLELHRRPLQAQPPPRLLPLLPLQQACHRKGRLPAQRRAIQLQQLVSLLQPCRVGRRAADQAQHPHALRRRLAGAGPPLGQRKALQGRQARGATAQHSTHALTPGRGGGPGAAARQAAACPHPTLSRWPLHTSPHHTHPHPHMAPHPPTHPPTVLLANSSAVPRLRPTPDTSYVRMAAKSAAGTKRV